MPKRTMITGSIALLFFTNVALGQCTVYYCSGCVKAGLCDVSRTFSTYEEAKASALAACPGATPDIRCTNGSGSGASSARFSNSPVGNGVKGALLLGLGGSLLKNNSGENQWATGAALGYGVFSALTLLVKPQKRSVGVNMVIGGLTGAGLGYAESQIEKATKEPITPAKPDKALERTLIGTGTGIVAGAVFTGFNKKTKGGYSSRSNRSKFMSAMAFTLNGNKIGIIVSL